MCHYFESLFRSYLNVQVKEHFNMSSEETGEKGKYADYDISICFCYANKLNPEKR